VLALAAGALAQQIVLRAADNQPPDYPTVKGLNHMAEVLEALSGGRIRMEVFPGGQLGDERSTIEQVQLGVIDVTRTSTSPVGEFYAPMGVFSMPFIFRSEEHFWRVVQGPIGFELLEGLRAADMVGLAYYDSGSRNFYTTNTPIRSVADLRGPAHPHPAEPGRARHDGGAGRRRRADGLRRGLQRAADRRDRRGREQLPVLRPSSACGTTRSRPTSPRITAACPRSS
jgi:hypothetical protein